MFQNFLVSGYGRCGTSFLAKVCNLSNQWKVWHEFHENEGLPCSRFLEKVFVESDYLNYSVFFLEKVNQRLSHDFIGHVSGFLRYHLMYFQNVKYVGVIYRDPRDSMLSIANRRPRWQWCSEASELAFYHRWFLEAIKPFYPVIDFERMISDKEYLSTLLKQLGVLDVEVTDSLLSTKVNATKKKEVASYSHLPREVRWIIDSIL